MKRAKRDIQYFCFILTNECYPMISAPMNDDRSCSYEDCQIKKKSDFGCYIDTSKS